MSYPAPPTPPPAPPAPTPPINPMPQYPALAQDGNIQGNVLAAFNKDFQSFLFVQFLDQTHAQSFLTNLLPLVSSNADVAGFNAAFSAARAVGHEDPDDLSATWLNISFTVHGLELLNATVAGVLGESQWDPSIARFVAGATTGPDLPSSGSESPPTWLFGRPDQTIDALVTLAADSAEDLLGITQEVFQLCAVHNATVVFDQEARALAGERHGHEHFGFKDGISQPGVMGFDEPDPANSAQVLNKPGTLLVEPGEFLCGYPAHDNPGRPVPSWMFDGSFLVLRRLRQDVPGWWAQADQLSAKQETAEALGAKLVGRWRSGVPVAVDPNTDPRSGPDLSTDNAFDFASDPTGSDTPLCAHIRKVNPRSGTGPGQDVVNSHRILRRGIAFGRPFDPPAGKDHGPDSPRGLVFACYQTSITDQFEFVQQQWADSPDFPSASTGPDPVIGPIGSGSVLIDGTTQQVALGRFISIEGALYAFTPSIPTLQQLASGTTLAVP